MDTISRQGSSVRGFSFDTAAVMALGATMAIAAVIAIPNSIIPFLSTKVSVLAVGAIVTLAFFILARLTRGNIIVPPARLIAAVWLLPLAYGLSALFSGVGLARGFFGTELESDTFGFIVLMALLATLAALVVRRRDQYRHVLRFASAAFALVLVAQIAFILIAQVSPTFISASANLIGSFADLGAFIGFGVTFIMLALRFLTPARQTRIALAVALAAGLFVLALTNSTLVWVLTGLVALGLFIEAIMRRRPMHDDSDLEGVAVAAATDMDSGHASSGALVAPLAVLAVSLFFIIGGQTIGAGLANALSASVIDVRPSWQSTFDIGSHAFASSPVFGSGPGTFGEKWISFRDRGLNETAFWGVDFTTGVGYVPTSFVTTGVVGALAWLVFFGAFLVLGVRFLLMSAPSDPFIRFVSLSSYVGMVYLFALAIFSVPGPLLIALAFICAGIFVSTMRHGAGAAEWGVAFARSPRIGFIIVFALTLILLGSVLSIYTVVERYLSQVSYMGAASALSSGNLDLAATRVASSIVYAPSDRAYRLKSTIGISRLSQIANNAQLSQEEARASFQATLSQAVSDAITATQLNAANYQNWVQLGNVYASVVPLNIEGAYDNAKAAYARAIELNPSNPVLPYANAQLQIAARKLTDAEVSLQSAISLKRNYTEAIFLLSQLEVQMGKAREALEAAEAAAYFAPSDPTILFQVGLLRLGTNDADGAITALSSATRINPQYANAHFFLAVAYAAKKDYPTAITELQTVSSLSAENATAVDGYIKTLEGGKNPFPASLSVTPVTEPPASAPTQTTTP